jgi:class 3 adenylate cyclase
MSLEADFSIVVHIGSVVAGMIGDGEARRLSAVGDAIRVAERLCASARRNGERFAISRAAANAAGIAGPTFTWSTGDDGEPPMWAGPAARLLAFAPRDGPRV